MQTVASLEREVTRLEETQRDLRRRLDELDSKQFSMRMSANMQETFLMMTFLLAIGGLYGLVLASR